MFDYIADTLKNLGIALFLVFIVGWIIEEKTQISYIEGITSLLGGITCWLVGLWIKFLERRRYRWKKE